MLNLVKVALMLCLCIGSTSSQKFIFQEKEYFLIKQRKTFDEANILCISRNERLVQIKSQDENAFIFNTIVKPSGYAAWLGSTNVPGTKTFKWIGDGSELTFTNWYSSNPNEAVTQRNANFMYNDDGKWDDVPVTRTFYVLCEQKLKTFTYLDKEYFWRNEFTMFNEAVRICNRRNESLLQIRTEAENDFVFETIVKPLNQSIWLGANNVENGTFKWLDGSDLDYSNWLIGQPSEDFNQLNAIYMSPNNSSKWFDLSTNGTAYVICEKISIYALKSSLLEQSNGFTTKIAQLDSKLTAAIENVAEQFTNWLIGQPSEDFNQLNAIYMNPNNSSKWSDMSTNGTAYVICEKVSIYALKSSLLEQSNGFITKVSQLDSRLTTAIEKVTEQFTNKLEAQLKTLAEHQVALENVTEQTLQQHREKIEQLDVQLKAVENTAEQMDVQLKAAEQSKVELEEQLNEITTKHEALEQKLERYINMPKIKWI